jgi:hypothetical protein
MMVLVVVPLAMISVAAPPYPLAVPVMTIFMLPAGWFLVLPFAPMPRRFVVVAHGYLQQRGWSGATSWKGPQSVIA